MRNNHPVHRDCEIACGQKLALRHREGVDNSSNLRSYTPTQQKNIKVNDVKLVKRMKTNIMSYVFNVIIGFAQEDYSDDCL